MIYDDDDGGGLFFFFFFSWWLRLFWYRFVDRFETRKFYRKEFSYCFFRILVVERNEKPNRGWTFLTGFKNSSIFMPVPILHGVKQGTPIQGRQKAPSKREVLVERKPQHPLLFAAAAAAPKDSKCFQDRPRSFLSRWFCHFAARKERALTRADHKTRRNRAISRDPADKPAFAAPPRGVSFLPRMQNCLLFFRAMPPPCPD